MVVIIMSNGLTDAVGLKMDQTSRDQMVVILQNYNFWLFQVWMSIEVNGLGLKQTMVSTR